jgi:hypothetical protein
MMRDRWVLADMARVMTSLLDLGPSGSSGERPRSRGGVEAFTG